ncbi:hypothetical protein [Ancylomarina longa]|uniref:Uncharacterized protein n=1 Tax=Ancylomarina longa TaxID=2487017 RepID=A0A434AXV3_9BACT|nr:hypothetical protein [Ancylomarina longa]RUT79269.1 hypothetical protein DLK05_03335 [Ancylomarina longa]
MDDSWGNIIYLLLMVVFVVVGLLKKKKPAVSAPPPSQGDFSTLSKSVPKSGLDSVLEALLGNEITIPYAEEEVSQQIEVELTDKSISDYKMEMQEKKVAEKPKESVFENLHTIFHEEEEEEESNNSEWQEVDWRKAIIYKEILDRKYN